MVLDASQGPWAGTFVAAQDGTRLFIDWVSSHGPRDAFTVELWRVPLIEAGVLQNEAWFATPALDLVAGGTAAFAASRRGRRRAARSRPGG